MPVPVSVSSPRIFIRNWGQRHRNVLGVIAFALPICCGFASLSIPGVVGVAFIVSGWVVTLLSTWLVLDVINWPKWFGRAWQAIALSSCLPFLHLARRAFSIIG
jgi:hypothetical protein